jgi:hypothetical protein
MPNPYPGTTYLTIIFADGITQCIVLKQMTFSCIPGTQQKTGAGVVIAIDILYDTGLTPAVEIESASIGVYMAITQTSAFIG